MSEPKKYLVIPDSFKGTIDAMSVCDTVERAIRKKDPEAVIRKIPIADGGEGTVDCFLRVMNGEKKLVRVTGPYGEKIDSFYGDFGELAVVEMAAAAGFSLNSKMTDPSQATTYGVGELIKVAVKKGSRKLILALGGSCTNDGGAGMAAALGAKFFDYSGREFVPRGGTLKNICRIDASDLQYQMTGVDVELMCDIRNTLYGPDGAAYVFAGQKGADKEMIRDLDDNLRAYANIIKKELKVDVASVPGSGAAGGLGAGAMAFLGAAQKQGIEIILDLIDFDHLALEYDMIITGEGKLDHQSLGGKVVIGIAGRAQRIHAPVVAVVGCIDGDREMFMKSGLSDIWQIMPENGYGPDPDYEQELYRCVLENI